ncbi:MAG: tetratricopeptide repeat protein [Proteobacteria bacterium]|nr:tetratricopeptide repeat protein [Pseudomonadota bacterium]
MIAAKQRSSGRGSSGRGVLIALSVAAACGPTRPAPVHPAAIAARPSATALPVVPRRHSKAEEQARTAFLAAVKDYSAAARPLDRERCGALAQRFGAVYDEHQLVEARFNVAALTEECGDTKTADRLYAELLQAHAGYGPALNNRGRLALLAGQRAEAAEFFRQAVAVGSSDGYVNIALLQRERALAGDEAALREAVDNIHRALAVDSYNIQAYDTLATLVFDRAKTNADLEIARLICVQAIKQRPDYAPVYNVLGLVLLRMDEVTRALRQFKQAVELDERFIEAQMNIGAIALGFRDYKTAEQSFTKVLALNPDAPTRFQATIGRGVAYRGQRRFDEALAQYRAAEALDANHPAVAFDIGVLLQDYLFDGSDADKGIAQLRQARTLLQRFAAASSDPGKRADALRRIRNIEELLPMIEEQQRLQAAPQKQP